MIEEPVIGFKLLNMESHNTPLLSVDYNIIILISPPRARARIHTLSLSTTSLQRNNYYYYYKSQLTVLLFLLQGLRFGSKNEQKAIKTARLRVSVAHQREDSRN